MDRTTCDRCGKTGHFARNCTAPEGGKGQESGHAKGSFFAQVLGRTHVDGRRAAAWVLSLPRADFAGLMCEPGAALVSPGAQGCVGQIAFVKWEQALKDVGLKARDAHQPPPQCCGSVGGGARIIRAVDAPVGLGGVNGVLRFHVVEDSEKTAVPVSRPVSFLNAFDAVMNMCGRGFSSCRNWGCGCRCGAWIRATTRSPSWTSSTTRGGPSRRRPARGSGWRASWHRVWGSVPGHRLDTFKKFHNTWARTHE